MSSPRNGSRARTARVPRVPARAEQPTETPNRWPRSAVVELREKKGAERRRKSRRPPRPRTTPPKSRAARQERLPETPRDGDEHRDQQQRLHPPAVEQHRRRDRAEDASQLPRRQDVPISDSFSPASLK